MKNATQLFALVTSSILLAGCTNTTSDASIRHQLVGAWSSATQQGKVIANKPDGTMVVTVNGIETARGKWLVSNGYVIQGPIEDWSQAKASLVESNKVLSISKEKAVLLSIDGHSRLTFHRQ
jgi:hypothetical protein